MAKKRVTPEITDFGNLPAEALAPEAEQPYKIPTHWKWVRFNSLVSEGGNSTKKLPRKNYLQEGTYPVIDQGQEFIGGYSNDEMLVQFHTDAVVVFGDHTRCVKYVDFPFIQGADGIKILVSSPVLDPRYLYFWLESQPVDSLGYRRHFPLLKKTALPLPPLDEQKAIIEKLQATNQKLDEVLGRLDQFLEQAPRQRVAIIQAGVTGTLTKKWRSANRVYWPSSETTQLFDFVTSGSRGWSKYYSDRGAVFLRMGNLTGDSIDLDLSDLQRVDLPEKVEGLRSQVASGDLLISITADVGHVALIRSLNEVAYINQHLALARPAAHVLPEFLAWYLRAPIGKVSIRTNQRGATKTGLGLEDIRSLAVLLPEPEEQAEIVRRLSAELEQLNQACNCVVEASAQLINAKRVARSLALRGGS